MAQLLTFVKLMAHLVTEP